MGQIVNLRPIGNRPVTWNDSRYGPITNRPQVTNLPHKMEELSNVNSHHSTYTGTERSAE